MKFSAIGISRHRLGTDGAGVTTLVGGHGCPLDCKYCLNPQCRRGEARFIIDTEELYKRLKQDSLYFSATGGGVTFGGGEPLLQAEFIRDFILFCKSKGDDWRFSLESCLAVKKELLTMLDGLIDEYIVDIKDMNDSIYRLYTGAESSLMRENLLYLSEYADKVTVKLPMIPGYNTVKDILLSENELIGMRYTRFFRFRYITDVKK